MTTDNRQPTTDNRPAAVSNNHDTSVVGGQSSVVRFFAHVFSYLFHPLFIPLYVICFLVAFHPSYFSGFGTYEKNKLVFIVILNTVFFPAFSVVLMRALGFIKSIFLHTPQDRIGPYLSSMIFYFWTAWVFFKTAPQLPLILAAFMTGVFLTTVVGLLSNIYFKISMHAMGMGGLIGIFLLIMKSNTMLMTWPLCLAFLIAGIVCTSRLLVSDHTTREIYLGLAAGILCQFIAALAIL
jgi:hypothetical protein